MVSLYSRSIRYKPQQQTTIKSRTDKATKGLIVLVPVPASNAGTTLGRRLEKLSSTVNEKIVIKGDGAFIVDVPEDQPWPITDADLTAWLKTQKDPYLPPPPVIVQGGV